MSVTDAADNVTVSCRVQALHFDAGDATQHALPESPAYHPKKTAARLQAATATADDQPILLRLDAQGHGISSSLDEIITKLTDTYTFIFDRLGIAHRPT